MYLLIFVKSIHAKDQQLISIELLEIQDIQMEL